jgi:predicted dehydrogenase
MLQPRHVALVGFGMAGQVFHAPLISRTQGLHLHTVVSSDGTKVHSAYPDARVRADAATAFADPSIGLVVIATPNMTHAPLALAALAQGKHVVVDKPFALDVEQAQQIVAAAGAAKRMVSVFHNRRWDADFLTLRGLVESGTLGEVMELHSHFDRYRPVVADRWREHSAPGAGVLFDLGPHLIDQALQLFGPPESVFADLASQREGAQVDDYFQVTLRYRRRRVVLHAGAMVAASSLRFAVHGTRASFIKHGTDPQEGALKRGEVPGSEGWGIDPRPGQLHVPREAGTHQEDVPGLPGNYPHFYRAIEAAMRHGSAPPVTAAEAMQVMQLLHLAQDSACLGRALPWK